MSPFWQAVLPYLVPSAIALIGVLVGHWLMSRSKHEENDTTAFDVVTNKLMALVADADKRIKALEDEVNSLKQVNSQREQENSTLHAENARLHQDMAEVRAELAGVKRLNTSLGAYVGKLIMNWPVGVTVPRPDDGLDFGGIPLGSSFPEMSSGI